MDERERRDTTPCPPPDGALEDWLPRDDEDDVKQDLMDLIVFGRTFAPGRRPVIVCDCGEGQEGEA